MLADRQTPSSHYFASPTGDEVISLSVERLFLSEFNYNRKVMPILLNCLEIYPLKKSDFRSPTSSLTVFFMKLFKTSNTNTVRDCCQHSLNFELPSVTVASRDVRFRVRVICSSRVSATTNQSIMHF